MRRFRKHEQKERRKGDEYTSFPRLLEEHAVVRDQEWGLEEEKESGMGGLVGMLSGVVWRGGWKYGYKSDGSRGMVSEGSDRSTLGDEESGYVWSI
jgi:hypothetical protein